MNRHQQLAQAAGRYSGRVERLYAGKERYGFIVADNGDRLPFCRLGLIGPPGPYQWTPEPGERVLFDRELHRRGPWAVKIRPLESRHRVPADGA